MVIKMEAAYHEAGHALVAHLSSYHRLAGQIDLLEYGAGAISVALSKAKLHEADLPADVTSARIPAVARDFGEILAAGYIAEQIAAEKHSGLKPSIECAKPDHELLQIVLQNAGLSKRFDRLEEDARKKLLLHWNIVEIIVEYLLENGTGEVDEMESLILDHFNNPFDV